MVNVNTNYVTSTRGIIKILQIIIGIVLSTLLCASFLGSGRYICFGEGRLGFAAGLNSAFLIANIVFIILNVLDTTIYKIERIFSAVGVILFMIALGLLVWWLVEHDMASNRMIFATVLIGIHFILIFYDLKILQGEISN